MPGCTVPNCSNSSKKGYKLYHFPTDKERRALWVKNCQRKEGWEPTKHTCICEAHFEDTQFESHRADYLRKLKPNAVPTIFGHSNNAHAPRKWQKRNHVEKVEPTTQVKSIMETINDEGEGIIVLDHFVETSLQNKRGPFKRRGRRVVGSKKKMGCVNTTTNDSSRMLASAAEVEGMTRPSQENVCFICGNDAQVKIPLSSYTETSKIRMDQKLVQLLAQDFDILVEDTIMICSTCSQILNCIDYVENVHSTLSKGIVNLIKKRFGMKPTDETDLPFYMKSLRNLHDFYSYKESAEKTEKDFFLLDLDCNAQYRRIDERSFKSNGTAEVKKDAAFECQICSYKAHHKALMIFHLRKHSHHFCTKYSCDFCSTPVELDPIHKSETHSDKAENHSFNDSSCEVIVVEDSTKVSVDSNVKSSTQHHGKVVVESNPENKIKELFVNFKKSDGVQFKKVTKGKNKYNPKIRRQGIGKIINKNIITQNIARKGRQIAVNDATISKDLYVTFVSPVQIEKVTSLKNVDINEVKQEYREHISTEVNRSVPGGITNSRNDNTPLYGCQSNNSDVITYTLVQNYRDTPETIVSGISVLEKCEIENNI